MQINKTKNSKITDSKGFSGNAVYCGIKKQGLDLMVLRSEKPCTCSAVFTTNKVCAAPLIVGKETLKQSDNMIQAVIVNSGNANAVTGDAGINDTRDIIKYLSEKINIDESKILMSSTGIIGRKLDTDKVKQGIDELTVDINIENGIKCAEAILTTDTKIKTMGVSFEIDGIIINISGIAKGSGMIAPNMATMLSYITSDVNINKSLLDEIFKRCIDKTFNSITVDGDMSTNDTGLILANGMAENKCIELNSKEAEIFEQALFIVMEKLAKDIVLDGEGASKFIEINVCNAGSIKDAKTIGLSIANSCLVKTAMFGSDPNWGRILSSAGSGGIDFDVCDIDLDICGMRVLEKGNLCAYDLEKLNCLMKEKNINIVLNLNKGNNEAKIWTSDLSYEYVKINAEYTT